MIAGGLDKLLTCIGLKPFLIVDRSRGSRPRSNQFDGKDMMTENYRKIDQMDGGFDLDKRIALEVMGWRELTDDEWTIVVKARRADGNFYEFQEESHIPRQLMDSEGRIRYVPNYSRNLVEAWLVIDRLTRKGIGYLLASEFSREFAGWHLSNRTECKLFDQSGTLCDHAIADSPELAICRAALKIASREAVDVRERE